MSYTAYLNNQIFFNGETSDPELKLSSAEVNAVLGQAGSFSFTVPPDNIAYGMFHKLTSYVDVYRDNDLIFSGRVLNDDLNLKTEQPIFCEGLLAILNDSVFRPIEYNGTLQGLVEAIVNSHNEQVGTDKQITVGTITIEDEYLYRNYETIESSWARLSDLEESYGGFFQITKDNNVLYLNWLEQLPSVNVQTVNFGKNILDITQESQGNDIMTVMIPLGAETENEDGTRSRVNITSVNDGIDYIMNSDGVENFGIVIGTEIWDDVTQPSLLKQKALERLGKISQNQININLSVVDLAGIETYETSNESVAGVAVAGVDKVGAYAVEVKSDITSFTIGQKVRVTSAPHGIFDQVFTVRERRLDLLDPTQNVMRIGETIYGFIDRTSRLITDSYRRIDRIVADYVTNERVNTIDRILDTYATEIRQTSEQITLMAQHITQIGQQVTSNETRIEQTANELSVFIDKNSETLKYFVFDSSGLWIGDPSSSVRLLESNDTIKFVDSTGNKILLEINTKGIVTPTLGASEQIAILDGDTPEWAIRKGDMVSNRHNLDFIYVG